MLIGIYTLPCGNLLLLENTPASNSTVSSVFVLIGSKHEDGTQSDSENGLGLRFANRRHALEERLKAAHGHAGGGATGAGGGNVTVSGTRAGGSRTAFMIEFYDEENPRKRRSYSFSQTAPLLGGGAGVEGLCPQPPSHPKVFSISTSATTASDQGNTPVVSSCGLCISRSFLERVKEIHGIKSRKLMN